MKSFKIIVILLIGLLAFLPKISLSETATADLKTVKVIEIEKGIAKDTSGLPQEVYKIPDRPHFLLGIKQVPEASYERMMELLKLFQMKDSFYGYNGGLYIDKGVENLGLHKNSNYLQLTSDIEVAGKKVFVIYPLHLLSDPINKEFIYMSPLGPKNLAEFSPLYRKYEIQWGLGQISDTKWTAIRRALGWAQFQAVKNYLFECIEKAVLWDVKKYSGLLGKVLKNQQKALEDPNLAKNLSRPVSGLDGFKVEDILMTVDTGPQSFVPDILVFGPIKEAWGIANWKVIGSERIVFYDILGSAYDFIRGEPLILSHEFTHTNPWLQGTPTDMYFNVEMWTALTNDLCDELMFFNHPYLYVVTDEVQVYFGYNLKEAAKKIWPSRFVSLRDFNRKEFEENIARVVKIREALEKFVADKFMPAFYADPYFWNTVNTKWCDTSAAWRIMMAFEFEPTTIFDPKKTDPETGQVIPASIQTRRWLAEQEAAGKIQKLAEEAMKKTGEITKTGEQMSRIEDLSGLIKCPADSGFFNMPPEEQRRVRLMLEQLLKENDPQFIKALGNLLRLKH